MRSMFKKINIPFCDSVAAACAASVGLKVLYILVHEDSLYGRHHMHLHEHAYTMHNKL